jgi:hypothetical protein
MALVAVRLRGARLTIVPAVLVLAAFLVLLVAARGIATARQEVPVNAHSGSPINRRAVVVTDAQHAALVVHAGDRPLVPQPRVGN